MANKRPAEQWYTGDWYRAVDVQKCCPATRGIWRDALDAMTNEQITGKIRGTRYEICQLLRCNDQELQRFFDDNKFHKFANVTFRNRKVTIVCRRLYRAYLDREAGKKRVRKCRQGKKRESNTDVTPYSSTSTSIKEKKVLQNSFDEARKLYPGIKRGLDTEFGNFKKKHTDWQEILPLLKPTIEKQIEWREKANGEFRPAWKNFSTWINNRCWEEEPAVDQKELRVNPKVKCANPPCDKVGNHKTRVGHKFYCGPECKRENEGW